MKHYTIKINKNNNTSFNFRNTNNPSKDLDNLILSNLIKMNPYLAKEKDDDLINAMLAETNIIGDRILIPNRDNSYLLKDNFDTEFIKAAKFLSTYTPNKKSYILFDNTPIAFFEDEIQIGYDLIPLYKLGTEKYYKFFTPKFKNTIINIYISITR